MLRRAAVVGLDRGVIEREEKAARSACSQLRQAANGSVTPLAKTVEVDCVTEGGLN